jgi:hypothetical protein
MILFHFHFAYLEWGILLQDWTLGMLISPSALVLVLFTGIGPSVLVILLALRNLHAFVADVPECMGRSPLLTCWA